MKALCYVLLISFSGTFFISCKKGGGDSSAATVALTTTEGSAITSTSAQSGGTITSDGGSTIIARGVCWSDYTVPTLTSEKTTDGAGTGSFVSTLTNLKPYTVYRVRAYASTASGVSFGNEVTISTAPGATLQTTDVQVNNYQRSCETTITINGFNDAGFKPITESGICWSINQNPTTANAVIKNGPITQSFVRFTSYPLFGINNTYYIRGFATSSAGTTYGNQITYTTGVDLGLSHGGGIIFYVDNTGNHGLIGATVDQGTNIPWAPAYLANVQTYASSSTDGASNTTAIINKLGNSGVYAAKLCRNYRGGGYTDWYLPSTVEINALNLYESVVGNFPPPTPLTPYYYWSSTEYDYFRAWIYDFNPLYYEHTLEVKDKGLSVRAIRSF